MSSVQSAIEQAATRFAHEIVAILRGAKLHEILELAGRTDPTGLAAVLAAASSERGTEGRRVKRAGRRAAVVERPLDHVTQRSARRPRETGRKRTREEVDRLAERALQFLATNPGDHAISAIARALRTSTTDLGLPLTRLRRDDKITSKGRKRATRYRIV